MSVDVYSMSWESDVLSLCVCVCVCEGKKLGFTIDLGKLHNVSLGQGQEAVAEIAMEKASKEGHWVILQVLISLQHQHLIYCITASLITCVRSLCTC